ncbi:MAG: S41 family peptidase [Spirochaetales bacterium]|uniref:S41 family peptidase n=1 Tax=Candidatus Thalassospirochaeta sargassi TaxID=3119039 RepID=A0AAJ1MJX0_9SPIO|nr:S41 family peptidase [Spirochaetales bacterium]
MKNKERIIWLGVTVALAAAFIFTAASPMRASSSNSGNEKYIDNISVLFDFVLNNYVDEVSPQQLYEGAAQGIFEALNDPYSVYLTPDDMEDFSDTTTGSFGGVGMFISKQGGERPEYSPDMTFRERYFDYVEVIAPIEGTPAYKAGISAGDFIISIDGESAEGFSSDEAADVLRGVPGTEVDLTIIRHGGISKTYTLTRAVIEVPTAKYAMLDDETAYLKIIRWTPYTEESVIEAADFFRKNRYKSLIIDVRGNPGGLLSSVVDTTDLILDKGTIVSTKDRYMNTLEDFKADRKIIIPKTIPIILLTDKGSASASEILAGALKDTGRAYLIGDTTFGKGSVQQIRGFGDSGFKLTTSRYYTPDDYNIDKIGIEPHLLMTDDELSDEELESLAELVENNDIPLFVNDNPVENDEKTDAFVAELKAEGITLEERLIRKLIREEYNRSLNDPPIYDLEYDTVLKYALELFQSEGFDAAFKAVK